MAGISPNHLKLMIAKNEATKNFSKNLANLKQFTEGKMPEIVSQQKQLMGSLEKLAQAAKSIQQNSGM